MESNEQTELTSKIEPDLESKMTAQVEKRVVAGGIEQKEKKDSQTWTLVWWLPGGGSIRGLNGNGKKYNKNKLI